MINKQAICLSIFFAVLFSKFLFAEEDSSADISEKPNIIVVMADDMGQWASSFRKPEIIDTPSLEYMAHQGVRFTNAMTPAPVCSAARASFHTGKMPSQHGVYDFLAEDSKYDANWLQGETLLAERLQTLGYRTALIGKWHATTDSKQPIKGFDRWLSYDTQKLGWLNQYLHSGNVAFSDEGDELEVEGIQAQFLTQEAIKFIGASSDQPFFVSLNYVEPHFPFEGLPPRLVAKYQSKAHKLIAYGANSELQPMTQKNLLPDEHEEAVAQYLAAVALLDEQLGQLIDALYGRNLLNNTLLVFVSDHGLLMGQYGLYGKVNATFPYNFYEETIRIPFLVMGPEKLVRPKQVRGEFVDLIDLHDTILDLAGAKEKTWSGPGRSLVPLLKGQRVSDWRNFQVAERGNARMITDGHWKLVEYYFRNVEKEPVRQWFDLSHPLGEKVSSLAPSENVQKVLKNQLLKFFNKYQKAEFSGTNMWNMPVPNANAQRIIALPEWH